MNKLFFGGVHPQPHKELSAGTSLKTIAPKQVVIPMQQHIGAPCTPLVQVGHTVKRGQKIGDGQGLCVPVHASVSGIVTAVESRPHPTLGTALAVVIDNDFQNLSVTNPIPQTEEEILAAIREAGIVGMGGAAFPGNVKALSALGKVDTLIANACECEPYITADDTLLRTDAKQVLEGMKILASVIHPEKLILAVEDNKPEAIENLSKLLGDYPEIQLRVLPTRYPQGAEKQLIQAVTGREIPPGQLPVSVQCVVYNVSTCAAVCRAVKLGEPVTERIVTVSGEAVSQPGNFLAPIGTSFRELVEAAGGLKEGAQRVLCGGPMMGVAQSSLDAPTVKATNSVLCLLPDKNALSGKSSCLRCGKCVEACPMRLQPLYINRYVNARRLDRLEALHVVDCVECGCCAYACPAGLPLTEQCRMGKKLLKEAGKK